MPTRSAYLVGWLTVTAVATAVGMGTVAVVRGAVGDPASVVTLSQSEIAGDGRSVGEGPSATGSTGVGPSRSPSAHASTGPSLPTHPSIPASTAGPHQSGGPQGLSQPGPTPSTGPSHRPSPSPSSPTAPSSSPTAGPVFRSFASAGGSVLARCDGAVVSVVSASPNQGYRVLIDTPGGEEAEVKFQGTSEIGVQIQCVKGVPTQTVESSDY